MPLLMATADDDTNAVDMWWGTAASSSNGNASFDFSGDYDDDL